MKASPAARGPRAPRPIHPAERRLRRRRPSASRGPQPVADRGLAAWMAPEVDCVDEAAPLDEVRAHLDRTGRAVPVVAADGWLLGIVTGTDLRRGADRAPGTDLTAGDVMSAYVFTLPPTASIARAAALMTYEGVGQLVVVDGDRRVVGLVTAGDAARALARGAGYGV